jgi:hypothetical protein
MTPDFVVPQHGCDSHVWHRTHQGRTHSAYFLRELVHRDKEAGTELQSLLFEMMAMDSDRHARLLQFVLDRSASRIRDKADRFA